MRLSQFVALINVTLAFSNPQLSERRGCPYASKSSQTSNFLHAKSNTRSSSLKESSRRAEGKDGVFFMNRIAPGTSELFIANADGSNEQKLLGNKSTFDYHASFSPDGKWITFTSERNGDGNSVSTRAS